MKQPHAGFTLVLLALALSWTTGCSDRKPSPNPSGSSGTTAGANATPLEESLACWRAGNQAGAVQRFLEIDWKPGQAVFTSNAPLNRREKELLSMSKTEQEQLMATVMAELKDLKQLAAAVRDQGTAAAAADPTLARRCFAKLSECGAALDQPEGLKILQLTAQAVRKMGSTGASEGGK